MIVAEHYYHPGIAWNVRPIGYELSFCTVFCHEPWLNFLFLLEKYKNKRSLSSIFNRYKTEKKSSLQDCVSSQGHFATRLILLRFSFFDRNSSEKIRMALEAPHSPASVNEIIRLILKIILAKIAITAKKQRYWYLK